MIRYVASHDFSGLEQETKILYIPMTLHTYLMTWSWMKNLLMRVWPSNTKVRDKKTKEFYVANYDPLYPFPLWISATLEILLSLCQTWNLWHEWDWSCQEKLWIQFIYLNRKIDFLVIALPFLQVFYFSTFNSYGYGEFYDKLNFSSFTTLVYRVVCLIL